MINSARGYEALTTREEKHILVANELYILQLPTLLIEHARCIDQTKLAPSHLDELRPLLGHINDLAPHPFAIHKHRDSLLPYS